MIFDDPVSIPKVTQIMEQVIRLVANKNIVDKGMYYIIPNNSFSKYKSRIFPTVEDDGYTETVINKYIKIINK